MTVELSAFYLSVVVSAFYLSVVVVSLLWYFSKCSIKEHFVLLLFVITKCDVVIVHYGKGCFIIDIIFP